MVSCVPTGTVSRRPEGRSAVAIGTREEMERAVGAMHGFGLWATLERAE